MMKAVMISLVLAAAVAAAEFPALGERLEEYEYPFEVSVRKVEALGQELEMAYMDVIAPKHNGRTVLLLHGKNFSGAYWERTAGVLLGRGYRVVMPDQIGFGKSSKPVDFQYSLHALAAETAGLLDELKVPSAMVVGHSMGGMLAARFALMYPERTEKLVMVNPIGLEDWRRMTSYQPVGEAYEAELKKDAEWVKQYMSKAYFEGRWKDEWNGLVEIQTGWTKGPAKEKMAMVSALTSDMIFTQPVMYEFPDIKVPTLLIIGDRDRTALGKGRAEPKVAETMGLYGRLGQQAAMAIPGSTLEKLEGIGHVPQVEAFDRYAKTLVKFLED